MKKPFKKQWLIAALCLFLLTILGGCQEDKSKSDSKPDAIPVLSTTVQALYPTNGANWNYYVKNNGVNGFSAGDTACEAATDISCLNGGIMRVAVVPGKSSCAGLTAQDSLGVFEWHCDASSDPVRMISTGLNDGKGLSDLIDFDLAAWKAIQVAVSVNGSPYAASNSAMWWSNPIIEDNNGSNGTDMSADAVYIVTTNPGVTISMGKKDLVAYYIGAERVALVIKPGVTLTGSSTSGEIVIMNFSKPYAWIEGAVDGSGDAVGVFLAAEFSTLNKVTVSHASTGVQLSAAAYNTLNHITVNENSIGLRLYSNSHHNTISQVDASGNEIGISIENSNKNILSQITTSTATFNPSPYSGIQFIKGNDNILNQVTNHNSYRGVSFDGASSNLLNQIVNYNDGSAPGMEATGFFFSDTVNEYRSKNNTLNHSAVFLYMFGFYLTNTPFVSGPNTFTGMILLGQNDFNCTMGIPATNLGLTQHCENDASSNADVMQRIFLGDFDIPDSFTANGWETLKTKQLFPPLAMPTGDVTSDDMFTHYWSDSSTVVTLHNAVEILGDGIGNENGLCESNETCLYTPNLGRYQGHGKLIDAGTIGTGGILQNIILKQYETNGY